MRHSSHIDRPHSAVFTTAICPFKDHGNVMEGQSSSSSSSYGEEEDIQSIEFAKEQGAMARGEMHPHQVHPPTVTGSSPNATTPSATSSSSSSSWSVDCIPLQSILDSTGIEHIDFFSLDVEGAELEVLETLDWNYVNIRVLLVELDGSNMQKDEKVRQLLKENGFIPAHFFNAKDACKQAMKPECAANEAFVNEKYLDVRKQRARSFSFSTTTSGPGIRENLMIGTEVNSLPTAHWYGTGVKCSEKGFTSVLHSTRRKTSLLFRGVSGDEFEGEDVGGFSRGRARAKEIAIGRGGLSVSRVVGDAVMIAAVVIPAVIMVGLLLVWLRRCGVSCQGGGRERNDEDEKETTRTRRGGGEGGRFRQRA